MHKRINGIRVELTTEEEQAIMDEWEANETAKQQEEQERQARQTLMDAACNKVAQSCGLTEDEKQLIFQSRL